MAAAIEIKNLIKHFGKVKAVDGVDLSVEKGEIFGFLGPNGAGKTTTIRCMMDFIRPSVGEIKILGKSAQRDSTDLKKEIGYLPGNARLYEHWSGKDHIQFYKAFHGNIEVANQLAGQLDLDLKIRFKNLSSGNKQKLALILSLMKEPKVLILDEPTVSLDPLLQNTVHGLLKEYQEKGTTIFVSSHNLSEVDQICNRVGIIKDGKIIATEDVKGLKAKRMHTITVYFADGVEKSTFKMPEIHKIREINKGLIIEVKGDINPILAQITKYPVRDIEITHATLEEIFLEFYQR